MNFIDHYAMIIHMYSYARQCNIITERVSEALNTPHLEETQEKTPPQKAKAISHEYGSESIS